MDNENEIIYKHDEMIYMDSVVDDNKINSEEKLNFTSFGTIEDFGNEINNIHQLQNEKIICSNTNDFELSSGSEDEDSLLDEPEFISDPLTKIQNDVKEDNLAVKFKKLDKRNYSENVNYTYDCQEMDDAVELYKNCARIKNEQILKAKKPLDIFLELLPEVFWIKITAETNKYRSEIDTKNNIKPFDPTELLHFTGLMISHSIHPWTGGMKYHWNSVSEHPFPAGTFGNIISRKRYYEIVKCLHFADNHSQHNHDKFYKIRFLFDTLNRIFVNSYDLGK